MLNVREQFEKEFAPVKQCPYGCGGMVEVGGDATGESVYLCKRCGHREAKGG